MKINAYESNFCREGDFGWPYSLDQLLELETDPDAVSRLVRKHLMQADHFTRSA